MNLLEDEVGRMFLIESSENLDLFDQDLLVLEKSGDSPEAVTRVFRAIHTIKGGASFLGLGKIESLAHAGENLLGRLRDGQMSCTREVAGALFAMGDALRECLANLQTIASEGETDTSALVATLKALEAGAAGAQDASATPAATAPVANSAAVSEPASAVVSEPSPPPTVSHPAPAPEMPAPAVVRATEGNVAAAVAPNIETTIRIDVEVLDKLLNLIGELVLARNQILQCTMTEDLVTLPAASQRLNLVTSELQQHTMKARMQPIDTIWSKYPRVIRDLSQRTGKQIRLEVAGAETELDRTIIEAIKDPLMHLIRNSADHGLELPDTRVEKGKVAQGCISLRAFHQGGQVNIEISDDGRGIDPERIKATAIQRGFITPDQASRISDRDAVNLIFLPGFSTAEKVTNISGRGVGMDVVKTNIERIGGAIDIRSKLGTGTTFSIKIPLTLAIIPALITSCAGDRYAIPQVNLQELVRIEGAKCKTAVEYVYGAPVYRLRGKLLPLIYLRKELALDEPGVVLPEATSLEIVIVQAGDHPFGLVVDSVLDTEEIVVKPLGNYLKGLSSFAGATIMGDGKVALILDVLGLAQRARVLSDVRDRAAQAAAAVSKGSQTSLLLLAAPDGGQLAVPLSTVARLEEFPVDRIERSGGTECIQYRGDILPLIKLSAALPERRTGARAVSAFVDPNIKSISVVVYSGLEHPIGIVVHEIIDIYDGPVEVRRGKGREGSVGTAIIQERITELLSLDEVIRLGQAQRHAAEEA